jgi:hypothetical protein
MIKFLKEWQGALVETIDARFVIIESLQVTSLLLHYHLRGIHLLLVKIIHQIKFLLNYWAKFFKNSP